MDRVLRPQSRFLWVTEVRSNLRQYIYLWVLASAHLFHNSLGRTTITISIILSRYIALLAFKPRRAWSTLVKIAHQGPSDYLDAFSVRKFGLAGPQLLTFGIKPAILEVTTVWGCVKYTHRNASRALPAYIPSLLFGDCCVEHAICCKEVYTRLLTDIVN